MFKFMRFKKHESKQTIDDNMVLSSMKDKLVKYELNRIRKLQKGKSIDSPVPEFLNVNTTNGIVIEEISNVPLEFDKMKNYLKEGRLAHKQQALPSKCCNV